MNILVLGSTGFIGRNLSNMLENYSEEDFPNWPDLYELGDSGQTLNVTGASLSTGVDLRNYEQVADLINNVKPDIIYNLASHGGSLHYVKEKAAEVINDNIQMTLNLYRAINSSGKDSKIIQPFSNCSYPGFSDVQKEDAWLAGPVHDSIFSFGNSKRTIYYLSKCYEMQYGIKTVNLLLPNTYGPGDSVDPNHTHALNGMIIRMLKAKKAGDSEFVVWGTGSPVREWCYVDDFSRSLIAANTFDSMVEPANIGQNKGHSIAESAKLVKKACGFEGEIVFDTSYPDGAPTKILSDEKTSHNFPNLKFFDHEQGIRNTVKYYEDKV